MLKEIFEQPTAARDTILGRVSLERAQIFLEEINLSEELFRKLRQITIIACGTSWHAGLVGKFLIETLARIPVEVDYGSEYRYRNAIVDRDELTIVITQSGETADTLASLREAKRQGVASLAICNVVGSMATRETDGTVYTHAGPEIGVASTKAFTSQLVALQLLALYMAQVRGTLSQDEMRSHIDALLQLPHVIDQAIRASAAMERVAERFHSRRDFLFLGRGFNYPIALEGALKLKEISYIHAEGYPAGEMKTDDRAHRREHACRGAGPRRRRVRKDAGQRPGGQGTRRISHRDHKRRRSTHERHHGSSAGHRRADAADIAPADADHHDDSVAAARVLHRRASRMRRRSAAQPRQERDGGIARD